VSSGFYDRAEREFYGFARVSVTHGVAGGDGFIGGDGSGKQLWFTNQTYYDQGRLVAEFDVEVDGRVLRGSVTMNSLGITVPTPPAPNPSSQYLTGTLSLELSYEGDRTAPSLETDDPLLVFEHPQYTPDTRLWRMRARGFDSSGNMNLVLDDGDPSDTTDDIQYNVHSATFPGQHFTAVDNITAVALSASTTPVAEREATYVLTNGNPRLTQISDHVFGGNKPGTTTPYAGELSTYTFDYDEASGDHGLLRTFTVPSGYTLTYGYDPQTLTYVTSVLDSFGYSLSSTPSYDFGLPLTTTDANGKTTTYSYDSAGRLAKIWGPTDPTVGTPTIQMSYSAGGTGGFPAWAMTQHKDVQSTTGDTIDTVTFVDGLGRVIQTKKEAEVLLPSGVTQAARRW
jgi:YD repeat-containing protein